MADDACWDPVTVRAGGMITYRRRSLQTGRPGDDRLIAYSDFNGVAQPIVGTLRVELAGRPLLTSGGNA